MIDAFFDYWLPVFVREMREQVLGADIANAKYQEVISRDGASVPRATIGLCKYRESTALGDMQKVAEKQHKAKSQAVGRSLAQFADTRLGKRACKWLQSSDLHDA